MHQVIDYNNTRSTNNVGFAAAVRHSGDMLQEDDCTGEHTIDVDLKSLAPCVREMYITISAFHPSRLSVRLCASPCLISSEFNEITLHCSCFSCLCHQVLCSSSRAG